MKDVQVNLDNMKIPNLSDESRDVSMNEILKQFSKQDGSRITQNQIGRLNNRELLALVRALRPIIPQLTTREFGNQVVQKLIETKDKAIVQLVYLSIENLPDLARNKQGCRIVQAILDVRIEDITLHILLTLMDHLEALSFHEQGNHVVQKLVTSLQSASRLASQSCVLQCQLINMQQRLSTNEQGCRVAQRVVESMPDSQLRLSLYCTLESQLKQLTTHRWGYFVVISFIQSAPETSINCILKLQLPVLTELCLKKYASTVVEFMIKFGNPMQVKVILNYFQELDAKKMVAMMMDQNATHVIQILQEYFQEIRVKISEIVANNTQVLMSNKKGSKVVEKVLENIQ